MSKENLKKRIEEEFKKARLPQIAERICEIIDEEIKE